MMTLLGSLLGFIGATFPDNANLNGLNFQKANFSHAKLRQADLRRADLRGAILYEADLSGADFSGTLKASITGNSRSDISATNVSKILDKLGDAQIEKMLGIGDEVPVKEYLEKLKTKPEVKNNERAIDNINKVIAVIIPFEEKIKSTTPSSDTRPSKRARVSEASGGSARN